MKTQVIEYRGFVYEYVNEPIPYNPNGGTEGQFICLDKLYRDNALTTNVDDCDECRKIIASNNPALNLPMPSVEFRHIVYRSREGNGYGTSRIQLEDHDIDTIFQNIIGIYKSSEKAEAVAESYGNDYSVRSIEWEI